MLSSSHSKIHDPRATGVSYDPRAADQGQECAKHEGPGDLLAIPVGDRRWAYAGDLSRLYRAWIGPAQGHLDATTLGRLGGAPRAALDL